MNMEKIGRYAFIAGLVISVIAGFVSLGTMGLIALVVLGVVVGFLNVTGAEVQKFLLGTVALMLVGSGLHTVMAAVPMVPEILSAFTSFVAGAALIVALKEVYGVTASK
jgi:uncharacterized membrane protein